MPIDWAALQANFAADDLEWRLQQAGEKNGRTWGICVPYLTNRAIMQRLDDVAGPENWKNEYRPGPAGGVVCGIAIRVDGEWVTKWDGAENTDIEGVKGGLSNAMKRAAVQWGLGRILYAVEDMFAVVTEDGRLRGKTKDGKSFRWNPPELPPWALPQPKNRNRVQAEHEALCEFIRSVGATIDEGTTLSIGGVERDIKQYVRDNWTAIRERYSLADSVRAALEEATGSQFKHSPAAV